MSQQINLLNPAFRKTQDWVSALPLAILAGLVFLIMALAGLWFKGAADARQAEAEVSAQALKQTQDDLLAISKQIAESKPNQALIDELATAKSSLMAREGMMSMLAGGSLGNVTGFSEYLRGFARQVPSGLWLQGFLIGSGGADMEIRGKMVNATALPEYIHRLNMESVFQGRSFSALTIKRVEVEPAHSSAAVTASSATGSVVAPPQSPVLPKVVEFVLLPTAAQDRTKASVLGSPGAMSSEADLSAQVASAPKPSIVTETLKAQDHSPGTQSSSEKK